MARPSRTAMHPTLAARRQPAQQRSRDRMERIQDVARHLIAQKGSDQLKMSEIAAQAGISIGSLYQYFPDKRSIIRTLAHGYAAESRACIEQALATVRSKAELQSAFSSLVDQYHQLFLTAPVKRDIWCGMRTDKELMAIELDESRACGEFLADAIRRVNPKADAKKVAALAFLVWELGEETMRLAVSHKRSEGALLVQAYKTMALRAIAEA
jgi:AcrR family transcriptional regulator